MESNIPRYRARVHPCGVATVGMIPQNKKPADERERELLAKKLLTKNNTDGSSLADCLARSLEASHISIAQAVEQLDPLGLSSLQNPRKASQNPCPDGDTSNGDKIHKVYGQNGITGAGKLRVKDGAAIMEQQYGRRSLSFATITLPPMQPKLFERACKNWGEIVRRMVEEIKRELVRKGAPPEIVYCTEIQEERYKKYGVVAPHLHLVWYAYDRVTKTEDGKRKYAINADWLRELVKRILTKVVGVKKIKTNASCDIQKVKKSAVGYLGKYMSKGGKIIETIKKDGKQSMLPRSWWGMTKELRVKVISSIKTIDNIGAVNLFYYADKLKKIGLVKSIFHVYTQSRVTEKLLSNREYRTCSSTGEITSIPKTVILHDGEYYEETLQKCYGAVLQLRPKAYIIYPVLARVLDICNHLTDIDIDIISGWISAIMNADMVNDVCMMLDSMKEEILGKIFRNNSSNLAAKKEVNLLELLGLS
jgi:hypothetical protein